MKTNRNLLYDSANVISAQPCSPNSTRNTSRLLTTSMYEASASRVVASLSPLTRSLLGSTGIFFDRFFDGDVQFCTVKSKNAFLKNSLGAF